MSDAVNHPPHYNSHPSGVECVTIAEHFNFNLGNALKYLWRAGVKSKDPVEDLRKSAWYLAREIGRLGGGDEVAALKARLAEEEARRSKYQAVDAAARRFVTAKRGLDFEGASSLKFGEKMSEEFKALASAVDA